MKTKMKIMTVLCRISSFSLSLFLFLSITLFSRFSSSLHRQHKTLKSGWEAAHLHFFFSFFCFFFLEFLLLKPKPTVPSPLQSEKNKTKTTTEHKFKLRNYDSNNKRHPNGQHVRRVFFFFGDITTHCTHTSFDTKPLIRLHNQIQPLTQHKYTNGSFFSSFSWFFSRSYPRGSKQSNTNAKKHKGC